MQPGVNAPLKLLNAHSIAALFNGSSHFLNFWTKCKFKVQIRIILPKQASAPSLWLALYCVVVMVESHCNLTSVLELDLKILKTHLSVILVRIKAIFSIYCPLSPPLEHLCYFLAARSQNCCRYLDIILLHYTRKLGFQLRFKQTSSSYFRRNSLRGLKRSICAPPRPGGATWLWLRCWVYKSDNFKMGGWSGNMISFPRLL